MKRTKTVLKNNHKHVYLKVDLGILSLNDQCRFIIRSDYLCTTVCGSGSRKDNVRGAARIVKRRTVREKNKRITKELVNVFRKIKWKHIQGWLPASVETAKEIDEHEAPMEFVRSKYGHWCVCLKSWKTILKCKNGNFIQQGSTRS